MNGTTAGLDPSRAEEQGRWVAGSAVKYEIRFLRTCLRTAQLFWMAPTYLSAVDKAVLLSRVEKTNALDVEIVIMPDWFLSGICDRF